MSEDFIDRIARRLTDRTAIFRASSAPCAGEETLRFLAAHSSAHAGSMTTFLSRAPAQRADTAEGRQRWLSAAGGASSGPSVEGPAFYDMTYEGSR